MRQLRPRGSPLPQMAVLWAPELADLKCLLTVSPGASNTDGLGLYCEAVGWEREG